MKAKAPMMSTKMTITRANHHQEVASHPITRRSSGVDQWCLALLWISCLLQAQNLVQAQTRAMDASATTTTLWVPVTTMMTPQVSSRHTDSVVHSIIGCSLLASMRKSSARSALRFRVIIRTPFHYIHVPNWQRSRKAMSLPYVTLVRSWSWTPIFSTLPTPRQHVRTSSAATMMP